MKIIYLYLLCFTLWSSFTKISNSHGRIDSIIENKVNSVGKFNQIEGQMNINGEMYQAICDCDANQKDEFNTSRSDQAKFTIKIAREGQGASLQDVENLVGNKEELKFVKIPHNQFKCLDGRNKNAVLATPGGDAGEFITALSVYEAILGNNKVLNQNDVYNILALHLKTISYDKLYMCTDDMAISHIERELSVYTLFLIFLDCRLEYQKPKTGFNT